MKGQRDKERERQVETGIWMGEKNTVDFPFRHDPLSRAIDLQKSPMVSPGVLEGRE